MYQKLTKWPNFTRYLLEEDIFTIFFRGGGQIPPLPAVFYADEHSSRVFCSVSKRTMMRMMRTMMMMMMMV